jgi:hypothetical protein
LIRHHWLVGNLLLMLSSVARHATFSAGFARFLAAPFMSGASHMRRSATHAGNLTLLGPFHRGKTAILFTHMPLAVIDGPLPCDQMGATDVPR